VSHDRHFLDTLAERVLEIRDGRLYDYPGNYSWFLEKREETLSRMEESASQKPDARGAGSPKSREGRRLAAEEREKVLRAAREVKKELAPVEKRIEELEARQNEIDAALSDPAVLSDSARVKDLMVERSGAERELKEAYNKWEELSIRLDGVMKERERGACTNSLWQTP
jgi:ATP-binding cassette subfamily F protein 3